MKHLTPSRMPLQRDYCPFAHLWNRKGGCFLFVSEGEKRKRTMTEQGNERGIIN